MSSRKCLLEIMVVAPQLSPNVMTGLHFLPINLLIASFGLVKSGGHAQPLLIGSRRSEGHAQPLLIGRGEGLLLLEHLYY